MTKVCFFDDGICFECTGCGDCCKTHGDGDEYAYVYLSRKDVARIASYLEITEVTFLNAHCTTDECGAVHLAELQGDCAFLRDGNRCIVYPVRPMQCRTWPFWSENMKRTVWEGPVSACCPGIGQGRRYTKAEILKICRDRDEWYAADDTVVVRMEKGPY
jgi:Fe-S-cluster containining protein